MKEELKAAAAGLTLVVFAAHAWVSVTSGAGLNLVSGVWLALARDGQDGLFYRGLLGETGYGGTRYFPLFFTLIAGLMRAGLDPIPAGFVVSVLGAAVLASGAFACARELGLPHTDAALAASLTLAPYFVQESVFAIRTEPLSAGLALFGARFALHLAWENRTGSRARAIAAACFTAAIAAKPTAFYAPIAASAALLFARRRNEALLVLLFTAAGVILLLAAIAAASDGRALEAFRVGALGGQAAGGMLRSETLTRPIALVAGSRLLSAVFLFVIVALVTSRHDWRYLPSLLVVSAMAVLAIVLASPGTILANQIVEPYVAAALFLVWVVHGRPRWHFFGGVALVLLAAWMAAQNMTRIAALLREDAATRLPADRQSIARAFEACGGPVLAESPLVPILAGQRPILLDPFAFRVAALRRPGIGAHLVARIRAREFACVILEHDPLSPQGEGFYRNVHFGWPVIEALLQEYDFQGTIAGQSFYRPRSLSR